MPNKSVFLTGLISAGSLIKGFNPDFSIGATLFVSIVAGAILDYVYEKKYGS